MDIKYVIIHENPSPFDEKQWIRKGKIFPSNSSAFPDLEGYCKNKLFIPEDFYRYTFPNSEVAVKDFLALKLPKESYALVHPSASTCFSTLPANDDEPAISVNSREVAVPAVQEIHTATFLSISLHSRYSSTQCH
ncbi:hypothetical protein L208DRAFT_1402690, partial [Tricholoma matsutake]